ncbi:hypothetical protein B0H16DRAFT_1711207 [Mycena metata]|uniref:Uncharacterized protein n=1 Tax=Mycena metata TaxID=1033252 RepID=A0AAD7K7J3_9AGAR|nr:hypothetical protein B0H16DRAFT_1711207 [Mycena metata]
MSVNISSGVTERAPPFRRPPFFFGLSIALQALLPSAGRATPGALVSAAYDLHLRPGPTSPPSLRITTGDFFTSPSSCTICSAPAPLDAMELCASATRGGIRRRCLSTVRPSTLSLLEHCHHALNLLGALRALISAAHYLSVSIYKPPTLRSSRRPLLLTHHLPVPRAAVSAGATLPPSTPPPILLSHPLDVPANDGNAVKHHGNVSSPSVRVTTGLLLHVIITVGFQMKTLVSAIHELPFHQLGLFHLMQCGVLSSTPSVRMITAQYRLHLTLLPVILGITTRRSTSAIRLIAD